MVMCTLCVFISLVWLREHIMHGGAPEWLEAAQEDNPIEVGDGDDVDDNVLNDIDNGNLDLDGENNGLQLDVQAPANQNDNNNNNNVQNPRAGNDEINWNPIEWDRAAEELTWERLLGLDGSLVFLEHVFWVVSLNTLFILVFGKLILNVVLCLIIESFKWNQV